MTMRKSKLRVRKGILAENLLRKPRQNRMVKLFTNKGLVNPKVKKALVANPNAYKLPSSYVWNDHDDRLENWDDWFKTRSRKSLLDDLNEEWSIGASRNFVQPAITEFNHTSTHNNLINSFQANVNTSGLNGVNTIKKYTKQVRNLLQQHRGIKFVFSYKVQYRNISDDVLSEHWVSTKMTAVYDINDLPRAVSESISQIKNIVSDTEVEGTQGGQKVVSGYRFVRFLSVALNVIKYVPLRGGSHIKTPPYIQKTHSCLNPNNKDVECFKWAVLIALHHNEITTYLKNKHNINAYKEWENKYNFDFVPKDKDGKWLQPMAVNDGSIAKFEKLNNIAVNVFHYDKAQILPLRATSLKADFSRPVANLLLLTEGNKHHYIAIVNLSALFNKQLSKDGHKNFICPYCIKPFTTKKAFDNYKDKCAGMESMKVRMPEKGSTVKFKNWNNKFRAPGIIYYDFEATNQANPEYERLKAERKDDDSYTIRKRTQVANSFEMTAVCSDGETKHIRYTATNDDDDVMEAFYRNLLEMEAWLTDKFQKYRDIRTMKQFKSKQHDAATHCHICEQPFLNQHYSKYEVTEKDLLHKCKKSGDDCHCAYRFVKDGGPILMKQYLDLLHKKGRKTNEEKQFIKQHTNMYNSVRRQVQFNKVRDNEKVRDHCHVSGKYLGAAHYRCNINRHHRFVKIPVMAHNSTNYDSHLIIKRCVQFCHKRNQQHTIRRNELEAKLEKEGKFNEGEYYYHNCKGRDEYFKIKCKENNIQPVSHKIDVIPLTTQKYMTTSIGSLMFIDSCNFLQLSLDKLAGNLPDKQKKITMKRMKDLGFNKTQVKLMMKKGLYPYEYIDTVEKFKQTEPPPQSAFYNNLKQKGLSDDDYKHFLKVWEVTKCKTFGDYHNIYMTLDTCLLADVFEAFRDLMLDKYKLDPAYYFSTPHLAMDCMLKSTGIEMDLISEEDTYKWLEKGINGGLSFIGTRYSKANNKYMKDYDKSKPSKYILYTDANSLYASVMLDSLPYKGFEYIEPDSLGLVEGGTKKANKHNLEVITELCKKKHLNDENEDHYGYNLEYDIDYPAYLHETHNLYPLLPESRITKEEEYSEYQKKCQQMTDSKPSKVKKLMATLNNKRNYISDIRMLKFALEQGLVLKKVHKVLRYIQRPFLKPFINLNTQLRQQATNDFEKDFFKLMSNSVYGKMFENVRGRIDFKLRYEQQQVDRLLNNPRLKLPTHDFGNDLVGFELNKASICLNKPIYAGLSILNLSKLVMYDFHYNGMLKTYKPEQLKFLFTDTDSLCYEVMTDNLYIDMKSKPHLKHRFDFNNYPHPDNPLEKYQQEPHEGHRNLYNLDHINEPYYFKDEGRGFIIREFVGHRSKMYSYDIEQEMRKTPQGEQKRKGIPKCCKMTHQQYLDSLNEKRKSFATFQSIRSKNHEIFVLDSKKTALNPFDDKTYILDDGITPLCWGHKDIEEHRNKNRNK